MAIRIFSAMTHRVVGFLQNCWFRPGTPQYIIDMYLTNHNYRRKYLANSRTGERLQRAFGSYYNEIYWDNASQNVGDHRAAKFSYDTNYMHDVIQRVQPLGIMAFGTIAIQGLNTVRWLKPIVVKDGETLEDVKITDPLPFHAFPHPMAYGLTTNQLVGFAEEIIKKYFL